MAQSPAHRLGQFVGSQVENALYGPLLSLAHEYNLYLDFTHPRKAREGRRRVTWTDSHGNSHDLDYVIEDAGSESFVGTPKAFIETAWRRYTKHSRNKAQEIQGALMPLAEKYSDHRPFLGAVLAGEFTEGALTQMKSLGFSIAYCPYETVIGAFAESGVDVSSEEMSDEADLLKQVEVLEMLDRSTLSGIHKTIMDAHADQFDPFFDALRASMSRAVEAIFILPLSGMGREFRNVDNAVQFITTWRPQTIGDVTRYELNVRYSNGDEVRASFKCRHDAISFLQLVATTGDSQ
ncbi:MAG: hypothetical protein OXH79_02320 [Boseongicola sp.]|nr:hypothetical protein [Boseongicola sp.]